MTAAAIGPLRALAGAACVAAALAGGGWGLLMLPTFWGEAGLAAVGQRIMERAPFKPDALVAVEASLAAPPDRWHHPSVYHNNALVQLRALEAAVAKGDTARSDARMDALRATIRRSLADTPADPFLWLILFWVENARLGFAPGHLTYLDMSYDVGPQEGWVALRRSPVALAIFRALPEPLAEKAVAEFAGLVRSHYYAQAAEILTGPGWAARERLLAGLAELPDLEREQFAKTVYRLGYDVQVPGVELPEYRPWR